MALGSATIGEEGSCTGVVELLRWDVMIGVFGEL